MKEKTVRTQWTILMVIFVIVFSITQLSCEKENNCENFQIGILKNLIGFDGCGRAIQLSDSTRLEPIDLSDFDIELEENKSVYVQYQGKPEMSIYQVGQTVIIDCIEDCQKNEG
ncbi:hypothetical protein D1164_12710 [Mariniphaga sediminis]|jgi:hypothetical protein|uniref:Uncharacterized protein n=1 Tax=Mariniphaga sediminis TaxID=1628158 RepID=A0A399CYR3_9BACT|nr:hypothetical protein [Mariniphaga sediminis]RIH64895.1 hypothetical protein D1164_12710 [Mariniphaga sediminis]